MELRMAARACRIFTIYTGSDPSALDLQGRTVNPHIRLRYLMETVVVRVDVGFGAETTGLYFNFGQLF
jgi:hypothetical protein